MAVGVDLPGAHQDTDGDGEVVGGAFFSEVGGGEVDGNPLHRELVSRIADGGADSLTRLLDCGVGEADDIESRKPRRDVYFYFDDGPFETNDCTASNPGEHEWVR